MATTFLAQPPRPGDGSWLTQQSTRKRGRRKTVKTFLHQTRDEQNEVEVDIREQGSPKLETLRTYEEGKERTSHASAPANDNSVPRTTEIPKLLSLSSEADVTALTATTPQTTFLREPARTLGANIDYIHASTNANSSQNYTVLASAPKALDERMVVPPHRRPKRTKPGTSQVDQDKSPANNGKGEAVLKNFKDEIPPDDGKDQAGTTNGKGKAPLKSDELDSTIALPPTSADSASIREKLSVHHGVKVSDPKPAATHPGLVSYPSSSEAEKDVPKRDSKLKAGAVTSKAPSVSTKSKRGQSKHHDGSGGARGGRAPKGSAFLKSSEIPKGDPKRWDIDWDDDQNGTTSSLDSLRADFGLANAKKKRDPGIDQEAGFKLTDWSGSWAPAPVDWDARPAFKGLQTAEKIEQWMAKIDEQMCGKDWIVLSADIDTKDGTTFYFAPDPSKGNLIIQGDSAPSYWIPVVTGKLTPKTFWNELVNSEAPKPFQEGDLDDVKPWWELYEIEGCQFLKHFEQPDIKGIDPDETPKERLARENDFGADQHTENRKRTERAKRDAQREKRKRAQERARQVSNDVPLPLPDAIKPNLNLYIRSANAADVSRIREIYNYYVNFTTCVPDMQEKTDSDINELLNEIDQLNKLPFLVACERGEVLRCRRARNEGDDMILPDKIVGFALADGYSSMSYMYRFTAKVEVYVDSKYYMKGIAKCLLDKLIGKLDPVYLEKGGYDTVGNELDGLGSSRVIQSFVFELPYDKPERLEWIGRWLSKEFGFKQVGILEEIGNKHHKNVNLAIFQRTSAATFDPAHPPIMTRQPS